VTRLDAFLLLGGLPPHRRADQDPNQHLKGNRAANHAIAQPAFARACVHGDDGGSRFPATGQLLN